MPDTGLGILRAELSRGETRLRITYGGIEIAFLPAAQAGPRGVCGLPMVGLKFWAVGVLAVLTVVCGLPMVGLK